MSSMDELRRYFTTLLLNPKSAREAEQIMSEYQKALEREMNPMYSLNSYQGLMQSVNWGVGAAPVPKPSKPLPEEHIVSTVIGFRAWNVPLFVDELRSVAKSTKWKPFQRFEAECASSQCGGVSCSCGIYAFNSMKLIQKEYITADRSRRYLYGECHLWGRVLECKDGYRAQFAYPKSFVNTGAIAKRMSEVFGVPVIELD